MNLFQNFNLWFKRLLWLLLNDSDFFVKKAISTVSISLLFSSSSRSLKNCLEKKDLARLWNDIDRSSFFRPVELLILDIKSNIFLSHLYPANNHLMASEICHEHRDFEKSVAINSQMQVDCMSNIWASFSVKSSGSALLI